MRPARRRAAAALASLVAISVAVAASGNGTTYAAFSDFDVIDDNVARAARVSLGLPGVGTSPELTFAGLLPEVPQTDSLEVSYIGTIPADVSLDVRPQGGSAFCDPVGDGTWVPKPGGWLLIDVGTGWVGYCSLPGSTVTAPVRSGVAPGTDLTVDVSLQLASWSDYRYSELTDTDELVVTARQSSTPGAGFSDVALGTIAIGTGVIAAQVPVQCGDVGTYKSIVSGTDGDDTIDASNGKTIVLGLGGNDTIDGGNGKDCLVGGDGDDTLTGGNGKDVLIGGEGVDTCTGGHAPDTYECETASEPTWAPLQLTTEEPPAEDTEELEQVADPPVEESAAPEEPPGVDDSTP